jgi:hypothetical protein
LRNSKGYVYLEMIAAFSICIFLILSIMPILEDLMTSRKNIILRANAHYLLYERLSSFMDGEIQAVEQEIEYQQRVYELTWKPQKDFLGMIEGCVQYENASEKQVTFCDAAKK